MDTGEPFGLPRGTVRGIIALAFTALLVASYWTTKTLDPVLAAFTLPYIAFYFGQRGEAPAVVAPSVPEPLPAPSVPGERDELGD